jgi:hypothetical protein
MNTRTSPRLTPFLLAPSPEEPRDLMTYLLTEAPAAKIELPLHH